MAEVDLGRVQGFSAYEVAKQNGYVGTEAQWLESLHGPKGNDGAPGKDGADGASAGFGTPMASVDANVGTPSVTIEASGSNAAKVFKFIFKNLKGEKGDKGDRGPAGSVVVDDALSSTSTNPVQNKVVKAEFDKIDDSLSALGKCKNLLKYTLQTTTRNGVTCTNNGDGTYTLNGTNKSNKEFTFAIYDINIEYTGKVKVTGCPKNDNVAFLQIKYDNSWGKPSTWDFGKGVVLENASKIGGMAILVREGKTLNNLVFKPMFTTNLNATYDDFVPYTGDGDTLTADVAELKNDLSNLKDGTTPAAKAVADEDGNNIKSTYAKKTEIPGGGSTAENVTVVAVSGVSQSVINNSKCKNDRVVLSFYITVVAGKYNTMRIADITSDHGPTEVVYGTAVCINKYGSFDGYTKPYPFQINKAKSIFLKINETFTTNMTFYISLAYDI